MNLIKPSDRILYCSGGMAGSNCPALRQRYGDTAEGGEILDPKRDQLNLLNDKAVSNWMSNQKPDVVILAAAKVGGISEPKQSSRLFTRKSADTNTGD